MLAFNRAVEDPVGSGVCRPQPAFEMPRCRPQYWTENVSPTGAACQQLCSGASFNVDFVSFGKQGKHCAFSFGVTRSDGTALAGSDVVPCGGRRTVDFHCDPSGACVGFRLHVSCKKDSG